MSAESPASAQPDQWRLKPAYSARTIVLLLAASVLLAFSAHRTELDRMLALSAEAVAAAAGYQENSQVLRGLGRIASDLFPLQISETREIARLEDFDRDHLPFFSHLDIREVRESQLNTDTMEMEEVIAEQEVLVEPVGYLWHAIVLMLETIEIAFWGTTLAVMMAVPLAIFGARNFTPAPAVYHASRAVSSFFRAMPELIAALFLVLAFGFGPIAGVLALGLHTGGVLGKFFADDVENADRGPQDALRSTGANRLKVLRYAVFPQVFPSYLAYIQYIMERNIRTATVIGIVGAGGIGQELKGRFEMFNYSHVSTIVLVILITVVILEFLTGRLRGRLL
jgi:phosphonate transport system permease protein